MFRCSDAPALTVASRSPPCAPTPGARIHMSGTRARTFPMTWHATPPHSIDLQSNVAPPQDASLRPPGPDCPYHSICRLPKPLPRTTCFHLQACVPVPLAFSANDRMDRVIPANLLSQDSMFGTVRKPPSRRLGGRVLPMQQPKIILDVSCGTLTPSEPRYGLIVMQDAPACSNDAVA